MARLKSPALPIFMGWVLSFGCATAQSPSPNTGSSMTGGGAAPAVQAGAGTRNAETRKDDKLASSDRKFIIQAAEGGMFEVEVAQLAETRATDANVKSLAAMMAKDHAAANDELVKLANSKHVELSAAPPHNKRRAEERLGKRTGADFDQHFVREVGVKDHEKDIKMFEKASEKAKDRDLKAWIDKTLPTLRQHLAAAQKLPESGGSTNVMGNRAAKKTGS